MSLFRGFLYFATFILAFAANAIADSIPSVMGADIDRSNYPWMVAMVYEPDFKTKDHYGDPVYPLGERFCWGTLIASQYVLTSTHCVVTHATIHKNHEEPSYKDPDAYFIRHQGSESAGEISRIKVLGAVAHPELGYAKEGKNELAILKIEKPLPPPYAPLLLSEVDYSQLKVLGFGEDNAELPLAFVHLDMVRHVNCSPDPFFEYELQNYICAFPSAPNTRSASDYVSCIDYAGAPLLVFDTSGRSYQIGVSQSVDDCPDVKYDSLFTKLSGQENFLATINQTDFTAPKIKMDQIACWRSKCSAFVDVNDDFPFGLQLTGRLISKRQTKNVKVKRLDQKTYEIKFKGNKKWKQILLSATNEAGLKSEKLSKMKILDVTN